MHKEFDKFRYIIFSTIVTLLFIIFMWAVLFDIYDNVNLIPICMPRTGAGKYLNNFFNYSYTVSTAVPILLYCSMVVYLFAGSHNLFLCNNNSNNNNNNRVTELRLKMRDHVFKALIFNTFWRLMTNVV
uniref:Uncharacterized protein n=1 Tax=Romanomermis culicivorax TaxID=13658 RepID=A0A915IXF8_ROMCU